MSSSAKIRPLIGLLAGIAAGGSALIADQFLAFVTLGDTLPAVPGMMSSYLGIGAIFGFLAGLWRAGSAQAPIWGMPYGAALVGLYTLPVCERLADATGVRLGQILALLAALVGALAVMACAYLAIRLARSTVAPLLVLAMTMATGLAINRNLVNHPLSPRALAADAAILLVGAALIWVLGRSKAEKAPLWVAGATLVAVLTAVLWPSSEAYDNPPPSRGGEPPHLILIVLDTLRLDVFQSVLRETPEGQELAKKLADAATFDNALAAAPWTAPSMGSILSGLYPAEHGYGKRPPHRDRNRSLLPLAESVPTLASRLSQRGWHTEAIIANPILFPGSGIDRGFVRYEVLDSTVKKLPLLMALAKAGLLDSAEYQPAPQVVRRLENRLDALTSAERPVFLWLHFLDPHDPYHDHPELPEEPATEDWPVNERRYREEVRFTARSVSRAIELLERNGLWQDSLAILVSDHGEMFPSDGHVNPIRDPATQQPQRWGHGKSLYNELVRIPLWIRPPGGIPGGIPNTNPDPTHLGARQIDALVSHVDIHDTVVDLLDLDVPPIGHDRLSLAPYLRPESPTPGSATGPATGPEQRAWALLGGIQAGIPQRGYVDHQNKLILYERDKPAELYDRLADPLEKRNLVAHEEVDLDAWTEKLRRRWHALRIRKVQEAPSELDEETRKRLEALGYLN